MSKGVKSLVRLPAMVLMAAAIASGTPVMAGSAHDYDFTSIEGQPLSLAQYRGQAILVVNTASLCGFTPQYAGLQQLWERYRDRGLVVLGIPSNQFGGQEPGAAGEIKQFCEVNFGIDFPMTEKLQVSGPKAHPFYHWVAAQLGAGAVPRWNFHKILVAPDGHAVAAFPSTTGPQDAELVAAVERALPAARVPARP
ncbi:MAG: glutathione peroxidase [Sneathiellaceae bacterium]